MAKFFVSSSAALDALDHLDWAPLDNIFFKTVNLLTCQWPRNSEGTSWAISTKSSLNYAKTEEWNLAYAGCAQLWFSGLAFDALPRGSFQSGEEGEQHDYVTQIAVQKELTFFA